MAVQNTLYGSAVNLSISFLSKLLCSSSQTCRPSEKALQFPVLKYLLPILSCIKAANLLLFISVPLTFAF